MTERLLEQTVARSVDSVLLSAGGAHVYKDAADFEVGKRMPDRHRYFVWRRNGKAIAFQLKMW